MGDENIKVVVRCRPLNSREIARGANRLISMVGNQTFITRPDVNDPGNANKRDGIEDVKSFTFDKSYWSFDKNDPNYATQAMLYNDLGEEFLDYAFEGYNTCIFAYGQTSAGKSYSMMGYGEDKGIMPLTCCELFNRINNNKDLELTYQVQVSYIEIYNERVRDLLNPKNKGNLKVREHPALGPYVEDLSKLIVNSFIDIEKLMDESNKVRTVAATNMNETSGRSHAVFTLLVTQKRHDTQTNMDTEKVSRISFVDLAGSERANLTGATGTRLKEGANINKSLTTFGKVIASLAEFSVDKKKGKKEVFVPYRDSVLTWLLKDNLGGNSKTAMIAAISPADYVETLSTLRYADATRRIKNKAVVNEDPNTRLIRELKEELPMLRSKLGTYDSNELYDPSVPPSQQIVVLQDKSGNTIKKTKEELIDQTQASEKLMEEVNESWAEKARKTKEIQKEREKMLEELGIMVEKNVVGIHPPKKVPYLVNLNEDPLLSECLIYQIKPGKTRVDGVVTLHPHENDATMVNGMYINKAKKLKSGFRIILGDFHENFHVFRFNNPQEVSERAKSKQLSINVPLTLNENGEDSAEVSPTSTDSLDTWIDWNFARREAALNSLNSRTDTTDTTDTRHITDTTDTRHTTDTTDTTDTTVGIDESLQRLRDDLKKIQSGRRTRPDSRNSDFDDSSNETYEKVHQRKIFYNPMEWIKKKIEEHDINYFEYSEFGKFIEIGRGGFGIVSKAETNDKKQVALKGLTNSVIEENVIKNLVKELKLLRMVSYHDNINRFLGITNDHAGNYIMVLEYADEGNLRDYLKVKFDSLQWENKIRMALDIACGLKCLHSRDIVHRDLHSKNILVNKGRLLIADFGLSKHLAEATSNSMGSRIGIIEYVEPQCLRSVNYVKDKSSDVYSLGVLLWEITSGRPPFCYTKERDMLGYHIGYMNLREEPIEGTPLEYQQLYQKCWDGDPKKRPDINHVFNEILNKSNANDTNEQCEVASNNNNSNIQSGQSDLCIETKLLPGTEDVSRLL
ncbi:unnamed protein product [Rhizophagus irregularis]|nr:unnamed protein product [Rhizophagus irregularis]